MQPATGLNSNFMSFAASCAALSLMDGRPYTIHIGCDDLAIESVWIESLTPTLSLGLFWQEYITNSIKKEKKCFHKNVFSLVDVTEIAPLQMLFYLLNECDQLSHKLFI